MSEVVVEGRALAHSHGPITPEGAIGVAANKAVFTGPDGVLQAGTLPVAAGGTGRASLTAGAFLRGAGAGAVTLTPAADVAAIIGAAAPLAVNTGWKLQFSKTTAGSFTWTAPDLFGGKPYYIGVLVIGGGGSGSVSGRPSSTLSGGASGYSISFVLLVTPGSTYSGVVGPGGQSVSTTLDVKSGNNGGASSFANRTAEGGQSGQSGYGAIGGQCSWAPEVLSDSFVSPYGGVVVQVSIYGGNYRSEGTPACCWNPFESKRILGAGGGASGNTNHVPSPGGKDPTAPTHGGGNGVASNGSPNGYQADQPGCGGGAALSLNGGTATSGKGADGAVMIYVQGVAA